MNSEMVGNRPMVLIRGAGEQASGVGWALAKAGFRVVMTEVAKPLMVRWPVCFGTAIEEGRWEVEGIAARRVLHDSVLNCEAAWKAGEIPVLVDPDLERLSVLNPLILVDAIMAKRNIGTRKSMASLTIGLGPGFTAGDDVHIVIETNRGHDLGRIIYSGPAQPNTGIPGEIKGISKERVVYSTNAGVFRASKDIGQHVLAGDCLGEIQDGIKTTKVVTLVEGVLRGLLRTNTEISANVKIGDIDPRGNEKYCWTVSEKARAIGSAVLLSILEFGILNPPSIKS